MKDRRGSNLQTTIKHSLIYFVFVVGATAASAYPQDCSKCDCNHFPIADSCYQCCGFVVGTISAATNSRITVTTNTPSGQTAETTFKLGVGSANSKPLKKGAEATVYYRRQGNIAERVDITEKLKGLLVPANEPDIPDACDDVPKNALRIHLGSSPGSSEQWTTRAQQTAIKMKETDILSFRRVPQGIAVSANIFSPDGNIVAQIVDNHFFINPRNYFRLEEPSPHRLVVYDKQATEVLNINFLNSTSLTLTGVFRYPGLPPVIIRNNEMIAAGGEMHNSCFGNSATAIWIN